VGHLSLAYGQSRGNPGFVSLGLGLDSLLFLVLLAEAL